MNGVMPLAKAKKGLFVQVRMNAHPTKTRLYPRSVTIHGDRFMLN